MCGIIAGVSSSEDPQPICHANTQERVTELTARMTHRYVVEHISAIRSALLC